jgi:FKBP-type peptidyl-prolyl cis-trans isomerase
MMKYALLAALIALSACGQSSNDGVMQEIQRGEKEDAARVQAAAADAARAAQVNDAFLRHVRAQHGVQALPSGLLLEFRHRGKNQRLPHPSAHARVLVHYEGKLSNGQVFDSSFARGQPTPFNVGDVVPGFAEALEHMRPGDEAFATIPPDIGYGLNGAPPTIPPNAVLQFRIILLALQEPGGRPINAPR